MPLLEQLFLRYRLHMLLNNTPEHIEIGTVSGTGSILDLSGPIPKLNKEANFRARYKEFPHRKAIPEAYKELYDRAFFRFSDIRDKLGTKLGHKDIRENPPTFDQDELIKAAEEASDVTSAYLSLRFLETLIFVRHPNLKPPRTKELREKIPQSHGPLPVSPEAFVELYQEHFGADEEPIRINLRIRAGSIDFDTVPILMKVKAFPYIVVALGGVAAYPTVKAGAIEIFNDLMNLRKAATRSLPVEKVQHRRNPRPFEDVARDYFLFRDDDLEVTELRVRVDGTFVRNDVK